VSSLTEAQALAAVAARWTSEWTLLHPTMEYVFENKKFTSPSPPSPWARVDLLPIDSRQHTLGKPQSRLFLRDAAIWVWLQVPIDTGTTVVKGLVDDVRSVFEGVSFDGIDAAGGVRWEKVGSDGLFYEVAVISPVTYYETR
jgi:hypothetical protein